MNSTARTPTSMTLGRKPYVTEDNIKMNYPNLYDGFKKLSTDGARRDYLTELNRMLHTILSQRAFSK